MIDDTLKSAEHRMQSAVTALDRELNTVRTGRARPSLVEGLKAEHQDGARLVRELERALLFLEEGWPLGAHEFEAAVDAYADFHWRHMRKEEHKLLPLAERVLTAEDWRAIDRAFAANEDPVAAIRDLTEGNGADVVFECAGGSPNQGLAGNRSLLNAIDAVRSGETTLQEINRVTFVS